MKLRPDPDRRALLALLTASAAAGGSPAMAMQPAKHAQSTLDVLCAGAMNTDRASARRIAWSMRPIGSTQTGQPGP